MPSFDKESYDVSRIFLTYLAFLGNSTKAGIALNIPSEVIEVFAAKEDWQTKLKTYTALRHDDELSPTDRAISRAVAHVQACQLRDIILRLIDHAYRFANDESLTAWFSPRNPKTHRPEFNSKILVNLTRALQMATRIIARTGSDATAISPEESGEKQHRSLYHAIGRAMESIDRLPGLDSVALTKEMLAKWDRRSGESQDGGKAI